MAADIFSHPSHPYTRSLLKAVPRLDDPKDRRLVPISGIPLAPANRILGCPFYNRCKYRGENCSDKIRPEFRTGKGKEHLSACVLSEEQLDRADFGTKSLKITGKDCSKNSVIVEVKDLEVKFRKNKPGKQASWLKILDQVSFEIREGETLGLVGESGCGKSTVARSILQLIPYTGGYVRYKGADLKNYKKKQLRAIRKKIQMIFQDPYSSLDPRQSAGDIVGEALKIHGLTRTKEQYDKRIEELFELVGLDIDMKKRVAHEFSGGQRQRLGIARALACDPEFIICDEPVSALDVSIQAQIINLLEDLQRKLGLTYLFIAHDLSVIKHISDVVAVMYLGKIIEISKCEEIYNNPMHPYTKALMEAVPIPDPLVEAERKIVPLTGEVPSIVKRPEGCCFHERCPFVMERCRREIPPLIREKENHQVACFLYERK